LVLERGSEVGGRCWSGRYKAYTLDLGGHLIEDGAVFAIFDKVGKTLKVGPPGQGMSLWKDGRWYSIRELYENDRADLRKICNELVQMDWDELDKLDDVSLTDWIRERTKSEGILELFGNFGVLDFNIFTYDDVAASETLYLRKINLMEKGMIGWSQYPIGGFRNLVLPLADAIREKGGEVRTAARVSEVLIENGNVKGVELETTRTLPNEFIPVQVIEAPVVISTLPIWHVLNIIPENKMPLWYVEKIKRLKDHPDCFFGFYAGVTKPMLARTTNGWLKAPRTGLPGWSLEPSAYDPDLAPEGEHLVTMGASCADRVDWLRDRQWLKQKMAEFEADMEELYPDLKEHCLWKKWYVVPDFALLEKPGYVGRHRPDIQVPNVEGLFCVSDTFRTRGIGVDASARAAMSGVERILGYKIPEFEKVFHY
jgi:phytoene dehydrogenase-like protein